MRFGLVVASARGCQSTSHDFSMSSTRAAACPNTSCSALRTAVGKRSKLVLPVIEVVNQRVRFRFASLGMTPIFWYAGEGPLGTQVIQPGEAYSLHPVGRIRSALRGRDDAPRKGAEGAPDAWRQMEQGFCMSC